jgi:hypothetical protein
MPYFCVQSRAGAGPMRTYWIDARSVEEARTLVAQNVLSAKDAREASLFDCIQDDTKRPPAGLIYSDNEGPITIKRT